MKLTMMTVVLSAAALVACASRPLPTARVGSAEAAVRAANEVGAQKTPEASLHLKMAQDELAQARKLINDGEHEQAEWLLARAEADAELAVALSREATQRAAADEMTVKVRNASMEQGSSAVTPTP